MRGKKKKIEGQVISFIFDALLVFSKDTAFLILINIKMASQSWLPDGEHDTVYARFNTLNTL